MKNEIGRYRLILGYLGIFLSFVGVIILLPLILLLIPKYQADSTYFLNFLIPGVSSIIGGILLALLLISKKIKPSLQKHQDAILLVLIWVSAIVVSSLPFYLSGKMDFSEAVFESTSGYATVGLTRLPNELFETHIFTFYRAVLQFFGGIGLVLVVTSAVSDKSGFKVYLAEGHGDKIIPNLSKSARVLLSMYVSYIVVGTIALRIAGVEWFDAVCHSISSVATGGFSSKAGGMLELSGNMVAIEIITMVLMLLGGTNFILNLLLISGRFRKVFRDVEVRTFLIIFLIIYPVFIVSFLTSVNPNTGVNYTVGQSFRYGTFAFMTGMTTTGYSNLPHGIQFAPQGVLFLIIFTNVVGAGSGSTAGGAKLYRVGVAAKSYYWALRRKLSNKRYIYPTYIWRFGERREINNNDALEAFGYIVLYIIILFVGSLLISLIGGFSFSDSLFEFSNALSSTGLSNGLTMQAGKPELWIMTIGMFAGRLEILAIYYAIYRGVRDLLRKETI